MIRAMIVTAAQMACYEQSKEYIIRRFGAPDCIPVHIVASLVAGVAPPPPSVVQAAREEVGVQRKTECGGLGCWNRRYSTTPARLGLGDSCWRSLLLCREVPA